MRKIKVFIADDHSVVREGLRRLFNNQRDIEIIGEAADGSEVLTKVKKLHPDVLILDINMPTLSGLEIIPLVKGTLPDTKIMILSMFKKEAYVYQALSSGADGYLLKTALGSEVIEAVVKVAGGQYFLSSEINAEIINAYLKNEGEMSSAGKYDLLSDREQQIFRLVIEGKTTKRIAEILFVSPKTVEKHRSNIIRKLGIHEPTAMLKYAIKIGITDPELWED